MATVFKAYDPRFERHVAVKVLPREFMHDSEFRARFNREAKTIASLEHPAIVPVYDYGEEDGLLYLVMRFMPGGSLSDRLEQGPISLEESAKILQRLGSALDRAHSQGIIHRDLKPSNVLFDQYGDAFLADFGIVRVTDSSSNLTASGSLVGTPMYMSPEQVYGDRELDGRSDIYALGVILFQMLTGRLPYEADTPAKMMMKHVLDPVPDILSQRPDLPAAAEAIVSKALAKERDDRFDTAADFSAAVSTLTKETPASAEVQAQLAAMQAEIAPEMGVETETAAKTETAVAPIIAAEPVSTKAEKTPVDAAPDDLADDVLAEMGLPASSDKPPVTVAAKSGSKIPKGIWVLLLVLLVACLGLCGIVAIAVSQIGEGGGFDSFAETAVAFDLATPTPVAFPLLDPAEAAAATQKANLILTREQLALQATMNVETAVAITPDTPTPETRNSDPAAATRDSLIATRNAASITVTPVSAATRDSLAATRESLMSASSLPPLYGPVSGDLRHELDNLIETQYAAVNLNNFVAKATIGNPFATTDGPWDFGFIFRQEQADDELRLVVRSDGLWSLNNRQDNEDNLIHEGTVSADLDVTEGGENEIMLVANGEMGLFILNGQLIEALDLSEKDSFGDLALGTGFYAADEQKGAVSRYTAFTVWPFVPHFGPRSGELEHVDDGFIKMRGAEVNLRNFVAEAQFVNPYDAEVGTWDWGLAFRETDTEYWLIVESNGTWSLINRREDGDDYLVEGSVSDVLLSDDGESNHLRLVALADVGYFFLNGELVAELDLSDRLTPGDVAVVTAFFEGNESEGHRTEYEDFTVWPLP